MQLNGSALNRGALNGAATVRLPVSFEGAADVALSPLLDATRTRTAQADLIAFVRSEIALSAQRNGYGSAPIQVDSALAQSVYRSAKGEAHLAIATSLYYVKQVYGFGAAEIALAARGDVGIKFGGGSITLLPVTVTADMARVRQSQGGDIVANLDGTLSASAYRRPSTANVSAFSVVESELDPSHIAVDGTRYIGAFGALPVETRLVDGGLRRQALLGSMELGALAGTGYLTLRKPTLSGDAVGRITLSSDFVTLRRGAGEVSIAPADMSCEGEVFVRAEGQAVVSLIAKGSGRALRPGLGGAASASVSVANDGARRRLGKGDAALSLSVQDGGAVRNKPLAGLAGVQVSASPLHLKAVRKGAGGFVNTIHATCSGEILAPATGDAVVSAAPELHASVTRPTLSADAPIQLFAQLGGVRGRTSGSESVIGLTTEMSALRKVVVEGKASIEAMSFSTAVINPYAVDTAPHQFYRAATGRRFVRPAIEREFAR